MVETTQSNWMQKCIGQWQHQIRSAHCMPGWMTTIRWSIYTRNSNATVYSYSRSKRMRTKACESLTWIEMTESYVWFVLDCILPSIFHRPKWIDNYSIVFCYDFGECNGYQTHWISNCMVMLSLRVMTNNVCLSTHKPQSSHSAKRSYQTDSGQIGINSRKMIQLNG